MLFKRQNAFSLVELSIVIAIISLLVGAIITGNKIALQSKITKLLREVEQYKTAIQAFRTEYQALPGDFSKATSFWGTYNEISNPKGAINGNGNGFLDTATYSFRDETLKLWHHLELAELTQNTFNRDIIDKSSGDLIIGEDIPSMQSIEGVGLAFVAGDYLMVGKERAGDNPVVSALTTTQAWSIDRKIDDAIQNSGDVQGIASRKFSSGTLDNYCDDSSDATLYDLSEKDIVCNLKFQNILGPGTS